MTGHEVVVIGPNPAVDIILDVPGFRAGEVWRSGRSLHLAGGKPLNVARTLRRLGVKTTLVAPLGGKLGGRELILESCRDLGIQARTVGMEGEVRTCVIVADPSSGESTVINERGPELSEEEASAFQQLAESALGSAAIAVVSGSFPPGLPTSFAGSLVQRTRELDIPLLVDTSGAPLRAALEAGAWAVKVNRDEVTAATETGMLDDALAKIRSRVQHVVVTMGAEGALYAGPEGMYRVTGPSIRAVNPIGAGDAFMAGLAAGLVRGETWREGLTLAASAAALVTSQFSPDIGPDPALQSLRDAVEVFCD